MGTISILFCLSFQLAQDITVRLAALEEEEAEKKRRRKEKKKNKAAGTSSADMRLQRRASGESDERTPVFFRPKWERGRPCRDLRRGGFRAPAGAAETLFLSVAEVGLKRLQVGSSKSPGFQV